LGAAATMRRAVGNAEKEAKRAAVTASIARSILANERRYSQSERKE
jgi:hypothetical protein